MSGCTGSEVHYTVLHYTVLKILLSNSVPFTNSDMFLLLVLLFSLICFAHPAKGPCLMPQQDVAW